MLPKRFLLARGFVHGLALAAMGYTAASEARADKTVTSGSDYRVTDLGTSIYDVRLNNAGQVAGMQVAQDAQNNSRDTGFLNTGGVSTPLPVGSQPLVLTDDGRVITTNGPFSAPYTMERNQVVTEGAVAGNQHGDLVGVTTYYPYSLQSLGDGPGVNTPYVFKPSPDNSLNPLYVDWYRQTYAGNTPGPGDSNGRGTMTTPDIGHVHPTAINDAGQIASNLMTSDFTYPPPFPPVTPAFAAHAHLDKQDLGTLGGRDSYANALNQAGAVTGTADTGAQALHAYLYQGGKMLDLGTLPGDSTSQGLGLNDKGDVVGISGGTFQVSAWGPGDTVKGHAFLFSHGVMEDLNDRIPPTAGLTLDRAVAINNQRQILAYGVDASGAEHAVLLSPQAVPEPSTMVVLGLPLAYLALRRFRNSQP